jgi:hypothetical protein
MRVLSLLLLLPFLGCEPAYDCEVVGSARLLDGWAPAFSGALSNPQAGDIHLANDRVQVVIQGPGRSLAINPWGGNIIDADVVREDGSMRDSFGELGTFVNLAGTSSADTVEVLSDGQCGEPASVRATGRYVLSDYINLGTGIDIVLPGALDGVDLDALHPLRFTTTYTAVPGEDVIRVSMTATNDGPDALPWVLVWLAEGGVTRAFVPGDEGWDLRAFGAAEYMVFAGDEAVYGMVPTTPERLPSRGYVSLVGGYALAQNDAVLDIFGYPDSADVVPAGGSVTADLAFAVGRTHSDVVTTLRSMVGAPACEDVTGSIVEEGTQTAIPDAWVAAAAVEGAELAADLVRTKSRGDGSFSLCVPPGPARLLVGIDGRPYASGSEPTGPDITVAGPQDVGAITLPPTGRLEATIVDGSGARLPSRLTVYGVDPSLPSPRLDGDRFDPMPPGVVALVDSVNGQFAIDLEPGEYDAVFTRGPEYSLHRVPFTQGTDIVALDGALHRVVDTTGHLSGDFHVHAQASPDALVLDAERVLNMAAEGVEILVSTDHAYITDYAPVVEELGLGAWMTTMTGQEITTFDYGHFNAFPLAYDPTKHNRGAIDWPGSSPDEIGTVLLTDPEDTVFQVNHPRAVPAPGEGNYFNNVDLQFDADGAFVGPNARDPLAVRLEADARMLTSSFVAVEVMTWLDVQGLHDWFNFLNAGLRFTATANSDTHTLRVESSGWPRNYVRVGQDDPAAMRDEDLVLALHSGRNTLSFGPFVEITATGATTVGTGETVSPQDGSVTVSVRVQAPTWIPVDSVVLWNGATNEALAGGAVVPEVVAVGGSQRLEVTLEYVLNPEVDTWVVAVASGTEGLFPGVPYNTSDPRSLDIAAIRAGDVSGAATAFGVTNPIFIDADGDGEITPSHLVLEPDYEAWRWEDRTNPYR